MCVGAAVAGLGAGLGIGDGILSCWVYIGLSSVILVGWLIGK